MRIEVITSFNQHYFDLIGKESVGTWLKHWPNQLELTCFVEGFSLPDQDRITQISFDTFEEDYKKIQSSKIGGQARKFAKKAWSFIHAMENMDTDWIVWLDADVITIKDISLNFFQSLFPNDALSTHMGVIYETTKDGRSGRWFVPETGFFAINKNHEKFDEFKKEYRRRYVKLDDSDLRRFYDNDVYGYAFEMTGAKGNDLCRNFEKGYKTPMRHTVLGPYIEHYKAKHSKADFSSRNQSNTSHNV